MAPADPARLLAADQRHVWHPYASAAGAGPDYLVESAKGVRLRLVDAHGERHEVVDGMASWWCAVHGYAVPELDAAAQAQLAAMSHVMFGGLTHEPAVRLAERLVALTPQPLTRVFYADSGSVSLEVAMKAALQAQMGAGRPGRRRFLTVRGGYHGDTFSPMSVTDPDGGMHSLWTGLLPEHLFAPLPPAAAGPDLDPVDAAALAAWEAATTSLVERHADEIAAVVVEPVLQGAGGMRWYPPAALAHLHRLARAHDILVIHDEIATGLWRTGTRWAADRGDLVPDLLCLGKALTGGYLTLAAVLMTDEVAAAASAPAAGGALMHGPTFMANPLACAIADASLRLLEERDPAGTVARLEASLRAHLEPLAQRPGVREVRVLGGVGVLHLDGPVDPAAAGRAAVAAGAWLRPFRDLVYTMPPYVTSDEEIATVARAAAAAAATVHGST